MTLLTVAEILSGETLVSPSGPIDAVTAANPTDAPVWSSSQAAELKAAPQRPVEVARERRVEVEVGL